MKTTNQLSIKVRAARESDIPTLLRLEHEHGDGIWDHQEMKRALVQDASVVCRVAVQGRCVVGFLMFEVCRKRVWGSTFVTREGELATVGAKLVKEMIAHMRLIQKEKAVMEVRERDTATHLLLRSLGFKCIKIVDGWFPEHVVGKPFPQLEAAYRFRFKETVNEDVQ